MLLVRDPHDLSEESEAEGVVGGAVGEADDFLDELRRIVLEVLERYRADDGLESVRLADRHSISGVLEGELLLQTGLLIGVLGVDL